jgi:hypothetical protein
MSSPKTLIAAVLGSVAFTVPMAAALADHVKVGAPATTTVVVTPTVPVPATQTLQADEIKAGTVRANTIYANKIEADEVRGAVHQTKGVKVKDSEGKIQAPEVSASIIYADEITANTVIADTIYVRDMEHLTPRLIRGGRASRLAGYACRPRSASSDHRGDHRPRRE